MFSRIQNLHISQTNISKFSSNARFSRIQNLHISQTNRLVYPSSIWFSRIQNLHISQTEERKQSIIQCLVEFKIYISLKPYFGKINLSNV